MDIVAVKHQGRWVAVVVDVLSGTALALLIMGGCQLAALAATAAQVAANLGDASAARAGDALDVVLGAADQRAQGREGAGD